MIGDGPIKNIRKTKDPRRVITKAANLLEQEPERWVKGSWIVDQYGKTYDENQYFSESCVIGGVCKVCLEGALLLFAKDRETYQRAYALVSEALSGTPFEFNDNPANKVGDVIEVLREAAA